ncbi:hypothetical protein SAMN04487764_2316 [Gillisia sp. Hel1_33_143]|uniref:hypothetical protein n=1 Tax=unclassified Gillisia TaxID=2615025 RepID=UPI00054E0E50|nr:MULTISPECIES: hypothetical protein [unclassified Gillisia]SDS48165.1 hypothetical protein SAMN04487764_2316 [Gillisia sp. Hel1_33_143]
MKKILLIFTICFLSLAVKAQDKNKEQIKSLKVAYITQEMNMSKAVAEKFWPIYNNYECLQMDLHKREHRDVKNIAAMSEGDADKRLNEFVDIERQEFLNKRKLYDELKQIFSAKEIVQLHQLEADFNKKLWEEYRSRKGKNSRN